MQDLSALTISHHAVCAYCEKVMGVTPDFLSRKRAVGMIAHRLHALRPLPSGPVRQRFAASDCVLVVRAEVVRDVEPLKEAS